MSTINQTTAKNITAGTWTKILSLTLNPGIYIITGQLNVYGNQNTSKYISIVDDDLAAFTSANLILSQVYTTITAIVQIVNPQTIYLATYSSGEAATVKNGDFTALKIK